MLRSKASFCRVIPRLRRNSESLSFRLSFDVLSAIHLPVLGLFIWNIFHNIPNVAVQNLAEYADGMGAYAFIALQARDLRRADMIGMNESILGDPFCPHGFP